MAGGTTVTRRPLTTPRAAAVAGVVFSALMFVDLAIVRITIPYDPDEPGIWLMDPARRNAVRFALNLIPFAGIAFLWFVGVLRDRLGALEDRFFATVFLGSGLLFVGSLFASAATTSALIAAIAAGNIHLPNSETYYFARRLSYTFVNVFAIKMAGVFIFSLCMIVLRTATLPRWVAYSGFGCGLVMLVVITSWGWIALLFPSWMLVASAYILFSYRPAER